VEAWTGPDGQFRLPLDIGIYDLIVEMPEESRFGWAVLPGFVVDGSSQALRASIVLRTPVHLRGRAHFDQAPASQARIRFFGIDRNSRRRIEVAITASDANGEFEVFLPPSLDP
ncbi:MAG: hypothetical protein NZM37_10050, partial [Sandaracinaceae bacterium]|nr:hypothetical protein [Sandaracinaceae bacterium]